MRAICAALAPATLDGDGVLAATLAEELWRSLCKIVRVPRGAATGTADHDGRGD